MPEKIDDKKIGNKESITLLKELKNHPYYQKFLKKELKEL